MITETENGAITPEALAQLMEATDNVEPVGDEELFGILPDGYAEESIAPVFLQTSQQVLQLQLSARANERTGNKDQAAAFARQEAAGRMLLGLIKHRWPRVLPIARELAALQTKNTVEQRKAAIMG